MLTSLRVPIYYIDTAFREKVTEDRRRDIWLWIKNPIWTAIYFPTRQPLLTGLEEN